MKISKLLAEKQVRHVECILPGATLGETAQKLIDLRIGALVVRDESGSISGIVSERDLLPVVANSGVMTTTTPVADVMTSDVITCKPDDEVANILRLMNANAIRHIPVISDGRPVDMVSIRELTTAYDLLRMEADTDPLTELSNRRPFLKRLNIEYARARRFKHNLIVAMFDVDHFKNVNDNYGHEAGDQVLRAIATILTSEFNDVELIGRLGGEEFAVIFANAPIQEAKTVCKRLLEKIESLAIPACDNLIQVTASVGLAGLSSAMINGTDVLKRADELLYTAKKNGRNRLETEIR